MRRITLLLLACVVLTACGREPTAPRAAAYVIRSGFSVRGEHVGVGAIIRVRGNRTISNIRLRTSYITDGRRHLLSQDVLRFCPPRTDCLWGQSFFPQGEPHSFEQIDIRVESAGRPSTPSTRLNELRVGPARDHVTVALESTEGTAYLLAIRDGVPVFGYSFFTTKAEGGANAYSQQVFPRREGDTVRAFLYPGPVPASVSGPVD